MRKQGGLQRSRQRRWRGWAAHSRGKCSPESFSEVSLADAARFLSYRSLKIGGVELSREKWDEADEDLRAQEEEHAGAALEPPQRVIRTVLPDWTRTPLPIGAPPANRPAQVPEAAAPRAAVGA